MLRSPCMRLGEEIAEGAGRIVRLYNALHEHGSEPTSFVAAYAVGFDQDLEVIQPHHILLAAPQEAHGVQRQLELGRAAHEDGADGLGLAPPPEVHADDTVLRAGLGASLGVEVAAVLLREAQVLMRQGVTIFSRVLQPVESTMLKAGSDQSIWLQGRGHRVTLCAGGV